MKVLKIWYWLTVLGVLILTTWLRLAPIQDYNFAFTYDQGRDIVEVRSIVAGKRPILVGPTTSINGVFLGPFYYYWNAIPFVIWNGDPAGLLYWQILWYQLAGLAMAWYFRQRNRVFGLISCVLFWLMPIGFYTSRYAWNANAMPVMTAWWLVYAWWSLEKPTRWKLFGLGLISGVGFQVDAAFGVVYFPAALVLLVLNRGKTHPPRQNTPPSAKLRTPLIEGIMGFGVTLLPQLAYEVKHNFSMTKIFFDQVSGKNSILGAALPWGERLADRYQAFLRLAHDTNHMHPRVVEVLMLISFVWVFGWYLWEKFHYLKSLLGKFPPWIPASFDKLRTSFAGMTEQADCELKKVVLSCLALLGVALILYLVFPQPLKVWYIDGLAVPVVLVTAGMLTRMWNLGKVFKVGVGLILVLTLISTIKAQWQFIEASKLPSDNVSQLSNQLKVIDEVYQQTGGEGFTVYNYAPQIYDYTYNYLFWWYGAKKYGYQPAKVAYADNVPEYIKANAKLWTEVKAVNGESAIFLVMDPDKEFPERLEAWKNNFKDYCVVEQMKFPWETEVWKVSRDNLPCEK